ncbi:hypothetical protein BH09VER1_BH09VER1_45870 [soil metagenome]
MRRNSQAGITVPELMVIIVILAVLAFLSGWGDRSFAPLKGYQTQMLSNMKQLHLATQQMALDGTTTGDTNIGWPGDTGGSYAAWQSNLIAGKYLSAEDFCRLVAEPKAKESDWSPGKIWNSLFGSKPALVVPTANTNAVLVYAVRETTDGNAVFLSSANFTNTPDGGLPPSTNAVPFGQHGFVIFHKAGDGMILANCQVGPNYTNVIGGYVPLCK